MKRKALRKTRGGRLELRTLTGLTHLRPLALDQPTQGGEGFQTLTGLTHLRPDEALYPPYGRVVEFQTLTGLTHLRRVAGVRRGCVSLFQTLTGLTHLRLDDRSFLYGVLSAFQTLTGLTHLRLVTGSSRATTIASLFQTLTGLTHLRPSGSPRTPQGPPGEVSNPYRANSFETVLLSEHQGARRTVSNPYRANSFETYQDLVPMSIAFSRAKYQNSPLIGQIPRACRGPKG